MYRVTKQAPPIYTYRIMNAARSDNQHSPIKKWHRNNYGEWDADRMKLFNIADQWVFD